MRGAELYTSRQRAHMREPANGSASATRARRTRQAVPVR